MAGAPLGEIKSLLRGAALFIGNDSGPAHMAAAFGVPVVVIFGSSDPVIWAPWRTASEVVHARGGHLSRSPERQVLERSAACGCTHERTAAAAGIRPPLLVYLVLSVFLMAAWARRTA